MSHRRTTKWTFRLFITPFHNAVPVIKENETIDEAMKDVYYPCIALAK